MLIRQTNEKAAGVRTGDVITAVSGKDTTALTFDEVMGVLQEELSPVTLSLERMEEDAAVAVVNEEGGEVDLVADLMARREAKKEKEKLQPKKMPSAKKLVKTATNKNVWMRDPIYLSSAVFAVGLPLLLLIASSGSN